MHNALDLAFGVGAHGDDVAALALGDEGFLQIGLEVRAVHQPVERAEQTFLRNAQFLAHAPERGAGVVHHLGAVVDAAPDLLDDVAAGLDVDGDRRQPWEGRFQAQEEVLQAARPRQRVADLQQVLGEEHAAAFGLL